MGRKISLTPKQQRDAEIRRDKGESLRAIAQALGTSEGTLRRYFSTHVKPIKDVAEQLARAEEKFEALPIATQARVRTLADQLKGMSHHLAAAGEYGAMTAHRLSQMAHAATDKLDPSAAPGENGEVLKEVAGYTAVANEAAKPALAMISANKDAFRETESDGKKRIVLINAPDV